MAAAGGAAPFLVDRRRFPFRPRPFGREKQDAIG